MKPDWLEAGPLVEVLGEARRLGFLGPGPVEGHLQHSLGFVSVGSRGAHGMVVDLGSGDVVPGLILALACPESKLMLLDANERRAGFLVGAAERRGLAWPRVEVVRDRAEVTGRQDRWRGRAELVVARAFGPPAVAAECAAPLLAEGGRLVVSEPPEGGQQRWPRAGVAVLGLEAGGPECHKGRWYRVLEQRTPCPERFPRRAGLPRKRPLF